jgi:hypothetical protein
MSLPCELAVQQTENGYMVRVAGRGTMQQSPSVRDFVLGAVDGGTRVALGSDRL